MAAPDHAEAVQRVAYAPGLPARDRAAAILVLVFGQQIEDVVVLTWEQVTVTSQAVTVRLGTTSIAMPEPLDEPWRELESKPNNAQTASHPNSPWVFRGYSPGQHIDPAHLRGRLKQEFSTRAAGLGTLHELSKLAPVAILAETLGYSPATIERHSRDSAAAYARYVSLIHGSET